MRIPWWLLGASLLFLHLSPASADVAAWAETRDDATECTVIEMCRTYTSTGACTGTGGTDQVVVGPLGYVCLQLSVEGSTGAVAANLETSRRGHDDASGAGIDVFPSEVTTTTLGQFCGVIDYAWVDVSANPSSDLDAFLRVCRPEVVH